MVRVKTKVENGNGTTLGSEAKRWQSAATPATMGTLATMNTFSFMNATSLDLSELESHLWESANILAARSMLPISRPIYFRCSSSNASPTCSTKKLPMPWTSQTATSSTPAFPKTIASRFLTTAIGIDVRKKTTNVGQGLQRAMREIEKANPDTLYGIFGDAQWTNKDRLSDALLRDLIEHFSKLPLGNQSRPCRPAWPILRIPDKEVCRRHQQEGGRVLYAAQETPH